MAIQLSHHLPTPNLNYDKHPNASLSTTSSSPRFATLRANAISGNPQKLIQSGVVRSILPKEAASIIESEGYKLLDVRPEWEREKALVFGSVHVPLFVEDKDNSPITLLKKWVHFGYIGLWTGQKFTMINPEFLKQVEAEFPNKEAKILSACGEGLRSVMAVSKLHKAGYKRLGWLAGGFNRTSDTDFPAVEGTEKLQFATIGGNRTNNPAEMKKTIPSMNNIDIVFCGVRPHIKLYNSYTLPQCFNYRNITTITTELIPSKVGIVTCVNEIVGQWSSHIMMNLELD